MNSWPLPTSTSRARLVQLLVFSVVGLLVLLPITLILLGLAGLFVYGMWATGEHFIAIFFCVALAFVILAIALSSRA